MTNYDILKEYEAHNTPVPSYEEWKKMKEENRALAMGSFPMMIEAAKKINQFKDIISKMCMDLVDPNDDMSNGLADYFNQDLILEIHEVLK